MAWHCGALVFSLLQCCCFDDLKSSEYQPELLTSRCLHNSVPRRSTVIQDKAVACCILAPKAMPKLIFCPRWGKSSILYVLLHSRAKAFQSKIIRKFVFNYPESQDIIGLVSRKKQTYPTELVNLNFQSEIMIPKYHKFTNTHRLVLCYCHGEQTKK